MFAVEALYSFSAAVLTQQQQTQQPRQKDQQQRQNLHQESQRNSQQNNNSEGHLDQQKQQYNSQQKQQLSKENQKGSNQPKEQNAEINYLTFQKGDKILVLQSYQNGWWYGNTIKSPDIKGFFPSNYVQVSSKPKPPPPPSQPVPQYEEDQVVIPLEQQKGIEWVQNQLGKIKQGPIKSDYYLGVKGYKNIKIGQGNQKVLKGDHVRFDVSTGLAKVPVKDQAPAAKAVRQMGYYFDYHQWTEQRNKNPNYRARPDPKKKKIKKLNLKGMK